MTRNRSTGAEFSFLEEPTFERRDGKITCRARVRCDGVDSVVDLELDGDEWSVVSNAELFDDHPDMVEVVKDEYAKTNRPPHVFEAERSRKADRKLAMFHCERDVSEIACVPPSAPQTAGQCDHSPGRRVVGELTMGLVR